jgi:hypothetical protein
LRLAAAEIMRYPRLGVALVTRTIRFESGSAALFDVAETLPSLAPTDLEWHSLTIPGTPKCSLHFEDFRKLIFDFPID